MELLEKKTFFFKYNYYNYLEKNLLKLFLNYISFLINFRNIKSKSKIFILNNTEYYNFLKYIENIFFLTIIKNKNNFIYCYDIINTNNYFLLKNLINKKFITKDFFFIYKIKIDKKKNFILNVNKSIERTFDKYKFCNILKNLNQIKNKYINIYKNLYCIKLLFYMNSYDTVLDFLKYYKTSTNIVVYKNDIFLYDNKKDILEETYKIFKKYLNDNDLKIDGNKTYLIDKYHTNLIFKNQILTLLTNPSKKFDKHALYLLKKYKKNKDSISDPLLIYNIKTNLFPHIEIQNVLTSEENINLNQENKIYKITKEEKKNIKLKGLCFNTNILFYIYTLVLIYLIYVINLKAFVLFSLVSFISYIFFEILI